MMLTVWKDNRINMNSEKFPYHESLTLQNLTVFSEQTLEFVPGLNVLVGENGTGKTHILKALYAWQMARHLADPGKDAKYERVFAETYGVTTVGEMQRSRARIATVSGRFGSNDWSVGFQQSAASDNDVRPQPSRPVFIPAIEMMAHARNMNGLLRDYADFDRTCFDFLSLVTAQQNRNGFDSLSAEAAFAEVDALKKLVPGEVEWDESEQRFYLNDYARRLPFSLVAEGYRKVSSLHRLIQLHWLPPGSVLFWDEPEVNLNPKWMDEVVEVLIALTQRGVQVFLATHSYVILKEIDLVMRSRRLQTGDTTEARFFGLKKERGVSKAVWSKDFASLEPNPILDQYDTMLEKDLRLRDKEIARK